MEYVDFSTNKDLYYEDLGRTVVGLRAVDEYTTSVTYKTIIDESFSGNEQRRAQWKRPRREWNFQFQKTPANGKKFREFFEARRGRYEAFKFLWNSVNEYGEKTGGDDNWYTVRFDSDTLTTGVDHYGYVTYDMRIIEVFDEGLVRE